MRYFLYFLLSLVITVVLIVGSVLVFPNFYINSESLSRLQDKFVPQYKVPWGKIHIDINTKGLGEYAININAKDLCITTDFDSSLYCFQTIDSDLYIDLLSDPILDIKSLEVRSNKLHHQLAQTQKQDSEINIYEMNNLIQSSLRSFNQYELYNIELDLDNIKIISADKSEKLIAVKVSTEKGEVDVTLKDKGLLATIKINRQDPANWQGHIQYQSKPLDLKTDLQLQIAKAIIIKTKNKIFLKTDQSFLAKNISVEVNYTGDNDSTQILIPELDIAFNKNEGFLRPSCELTIASEDWLPLMCNLGIFTKVPKQKGKKLFKVTALIDAKIKNEILITDKLSEIFNAKAEVKNQDKNFFDISGGAAAQFYISSNTSSFDITDMDLKLLVNKYENFVHFLGQFNILVPPPFHALRGDLQFLLTDFQRIDANTYNLPIRFQANLDKSQYNQALLTAKANLLYSRNKKSKLDADVQISKLYFYLPNIDPIKGLPPFKSDSRIQKDIQPTVIKESAIEYDIQVTTTSNDSVRIHYKYIDPYLGLGVNFKMKNQKNNQMSFQVAKSNKTTFLEYIKRRLQIIKFNLSKQPLNENTDLDIQLMYTISGYKLFINIEGLSSNPALILKSEPSLPRDEIISLMLYGKSSSRLEGNQKESVGSTQAAINDRALGLFSIWAFASTPIESVSYDSSRKVYSANISLPGGVGLNIGTNWEQVNSLSLRKYIDNGWSVVTSYEPNDISEEKSDFLLKKEISY